LGTLAPPQCHPGEINGPVAVGFKLFPEHWKSGPFDELLLDPRVKKVILRRRDCLEVYVSLLRALQSGRFLTRQLDDISVEVDPALFQHFCNRYNAWYRKFEQLCCGRNVFHLYYEDLNSPRRSDVLRALLRFLGLEGLHVPRPLVETLKQSSVPMHQAVVNYNQLRRAFWQADAGEHGHEFGDFPWPGQGRESKPICKERDGAEECVSPAVTYPSCPPSPQPHLVRVCVAGGGGFIGSHLGRRLMKEGYYVVAADLRRSPFMLEAEYCNEFRQVDLRVRANSRCAVRGCSQVYNLAADMGGMGFIDTCQSEILRNNGLINIYLLEASREEKSVHRYFFASSACVYNEELQMDARYCSLGEDDAFPAAPQDSYGWEKLNAERNALQFGKDFPEDLQVRVARFHNVFGSHGTWRGGREKVPAAFCRKAALLAHTRGEQSFEIWGDGKQSRSFLHVDECVEGCLRIMLSDYKNPLNLGSDQLITINGLAKLVLKVAGISEDDVALRYNPLGPMGVRGRCSNNQRIRDVLGWAPSASLECGLKLTLEWVTSQVKEAVNNGDDLNSFSKSEVVNQTMESLSRIAV
jgi:nucleoside-diphosphate-sugar epimerase